MYIYTYIYIGLTLTLNLSFDMFVVLFLTVSSGPVGSVCVSLRAG